MKKMKNSTSDSAFDASYNLNNASVNYQTPPSGVNYATPNYTSSAPGYQYLTIARSSRPCGQAVKAQPSLLDAHYAIVSRKDNSNNKSTSTMSAATMAKHSDPATNRYTCSPGHGFDHHSGHDVCNGYHESEFANEQFRTTEEQFRTSEEQFRTSEQFRNDCPTTDLDSCTMVPESNNGQCGQCTMTYPDDRDCEWIPPPPDSECPID